MFSRDFMPRSYNTALEQRECRFNGIGVNIAVCILARMVDGFVNAALQFVQGPRIDGRFVGHNHFHMPANVRVDNLFHRGGLGILRANQPEIAVALTDTDHNLLVTSRSPSPRLAADIGLVNLDYSTKLGLSRFQHCCADTMAE